MFSGLQMVWEWSGNYLGMSAVNLPHNWVIFYRWLKIYLFFLKEGFLSNTSNKIIRIKPGFFYLWFTLARKFKLQWCAQWASFWQTLSPVCFNVHVSYWLKLKLKRNLWNKILKSYCPLRSDTCISNISNVMVFFVSTWYVNSLSILLTKCNR